MLSVLAASFCWFWIMTLPHGATWCRWYQFRALVVVLYAVLCVRWRTPHLLTVPDSLAQTLVVLHLVWMLFHFLYGDRRMRRDYGR